jgi:tryptophan synthase alpha chain
MTRIDQRFSALRAAGRKGFIAYLTAGDPDLSTTHDIVLALEDAGVDIVELGVPFSDPLADGRVNQESAARALASGTTLPGVLEMITRLRTRSQIPLMFYAYANLFNAPGLDRSIRAAAKAGVDGLLMLDLPVEEGAECEDLLRKHGINNVCLVTPTTPDARIGQIVRHASGFVYCVSREGVTGIQAQLATSASDVVARTRKKTKLPVALGFGIGTPQQARAAAAAADAIVVGSAIVNRFHEAPKNPPGIRAAARWVGQLVKAARSAS